MKVFPLQGGGLWREEVFEEGGVNGWRGVERWERWEPGSLAGSHELLGGPDILRGDHLPCLKHANGLVLDKPCKPSYDSPASFRIIVLLKTISKILERIMTVRLSSLARAAGLLHPNQCGSLPGLSTLDALCHPNTQSSHPPAAQMGISTLFLDIKAGFDNLNA